MENETENIWELRTTRENEYTIIQNILKLKTVRQFPEKSCLQTV